MTILPVSGIDCKSGLVNCLDNAIVCAAAANVAIEFLLYLRVGRGMRLSKESDRGEDHAAGTIAALHGVAIKERLLNRMQVFAIGQTFDSGNVAAGNCVDRRDAGAMSNAIHQHSASAALSFPAAVFGAGQIQFIAQNPQKRPLRVGLECAALTVYG
jgi:hypothetical protein